MSYLDQMYPSLKKGFVKDYTDLLAYRTSIQLNQEIFETTKRFPKEEMYSLTDQVRRAIRSVGANIAEAWGKRWYEKHFISNQCRCRTPGDATLAENVVYLRIY